MKPLLLLLSVLLTVCSLSAQWREVNPPSNPFNNTILTTTVDKTGKLYAAGRGTDSLHQFVVATLTNGLWGEVGGAHSLKATNTINALAVDSSGNLYAGGGFTDATGNEYVAKWDGSQWSELGAGSVSVPISATGETFCLATDKAGNVYAAGELIDSTGAYYVCKWDGQSWTILGTGVHGLHANGIIYSILPDASGNLYAAGHFTNSGGSYYVARWNGTDWAEAGAGAGALKANSYITTLTKDGSGNISGAYNSWRRIRRNPRNCP